MGVINGLFSRLFTLDSSAPKRQMVIRDVSLVFVTSEGEKLPSGGARFAPEKGLIIEMPDKAGIRRTFKIRKATPVANLLPVYLIVLDEIEKGAKVER